MELGLAQEQRREGFYMSSNTVFINAEEMMLFAV